VQQRGEDERRAVGAREAEDFRHLVRESRDAHGVRVSVGFKLVRRRRQTCERFARDPLVFRKLDSHRVQA
jgi:hypothetical protein